MIRPLHLALSILLCCVGCQEVRETGGFGERVVDLLSGQTPRKAAVRMEDQDFADERRQGINQLVDRSWGKKPPYTDRYQQIAQSDRDYLVRATAVRALNRARLKDASPLFIRALDDPSATVRLEGAKALINMPDDKAVPALVRVVTSANEDRDVRIAAAEALKHHRSLEVARALIAQLRGREFGVAWQSRSSLRQLTGVDHHYDEGAWLEYITGPDKPFG
jgi:hypothetical protein